MIGFYSLVVAIGVAFSTFLVTSFNSLNKFQTKTSQVVNYETTSLAASNRIAKESAEFLTDLKSSLNASDDDCDKTSPKESLEELISDLEDHTENQLSKTIAYGLKGKQDYKLELIHSDYIPVKLKEEDKKYASTMLSGKTEAAIFATGDLSRFIEDDKLKISKDLLSDLCTEDKLEEVLTKQDELGIFVSPAGINTQNLPNGLRLFLKKSVISSEARDPVDQAQYLSRTSVAQIRLGKVEIKITCTPGVDCTCHDLGNCTCHDLGTCTCHDLGNCTCHDLGNCPPPPPDEVRRLELALEMVPLSERGFLYIPGMTINGSNPLQIINKKEGGYSSIFVREDGYLQISIGSISKTLGNNTPNIDYFDEATLSIDPVTLTFEDKEVKSGAAVKITEDRKVTLDIDPRGRTSYSVVKESFTVNNITIPKGTIIAGIKEIGVHERLAEIGEFEQFRAYDPNTGELITFFGQGKLETAGCAGSKKCFDVKQFATEPGTTQNNAKVFYTFSLEDLMPGVSAFDSVDSWINIQADLTENMINGLNSKDAQWMKEELKLLNDAMTVYTGYDKIDSLTVNDTDEIDRLLNEYETGGTQALQRSLGISNELPSLSRTRYSTDELTQLRLKLEAKNDALALFALNKLNTWKEKKYLLEGSDSEKQIKELTQKLNDSRDKFFAARDDYDKFLQDFGNSPNVLTKRELQDLLADPNITAEERTEYQAELDKILAAEAKAAAEEAARKAEAERKAAEDLQKAIDANKAVLNQHLKDLEAGLAELETKLTNQQAKKAKLKKQGASLEDINAKIKQTKKAIEGIKAAIQFTEQSIANLG